MSDRLRYRRCTVSGEYNVNSELYIFTACTVAKSLRLDSAQGCSARKITGCIGLKSENSCHRLSFREYGQFDMPDYTPLTTG